MSYNSSTVLESHASQVINIGWEEVSQKYSLIGAFAVVSALTIWWFSFARYTSQNAGTKMGVTTSNLADEFTSPKTYRDDYVVKSIWIYPIKSCKGIELIEANVVGTGLQYDRQLTFAVLKPATKTKTEDFWDCMTQRSYPLLAKVHTSIVLDHKLPTKGTLRVSFEHPQKWSKLLGKRVEFNLPLLELEENVKTYPMAPVHIWKEFPYAMEMVSVRPILPQLKQFLGIPEATQIALFRMPPAKQRSVYRNAPRAQELGHQPLVGFADSYPIHLMNLSSNQDLNTRIKADIPQLSIARFRANIIVSGGLRPYEEDYWKEMKIGMSEYLAVTRTVRCKLPNTDQNTGEKHPVEPDKTMRKYRNIDKGSLMNACMGLQLVPKKQEAVLRVGDKLEVLTTGDHLYIPL